MSTRLDLILKLNCQCDQLVELTNKVCDLNKKYNEIDNDYNEYKDVKIRDDRYGLLNSRVRKVNRMIQITKELIDETLTELKCYDDSVISVDRL